MCSEIGRRNAKTCTLALEDFEICNHPAPTCDNTTNLTSHHSFQTQPRRGQSHTHLILIPLREQETRLLYAPHDLAWTCIGLGTRLYKLQHSSPPTSERFVPPTSAPTSHTLTYCDSLTRAFLYCWITALTSGAPLGGNRAHDFMAIMVYAVLRVYTPEMFPTEDRRTGKCECGDSQCPVSWHRL